jgi:tRNA (cytosine40_48-C5)-methyltransferase
MSKKHNHPNDLQEKGQKFEEVSEAEAPTADRGGEFFLKRYRSIDPSARIIDDEPAQALRVNTLRITATDLQEQLNKRGAFLKKIDFLENGYYVKASFSLGATPEYLLGLYYLQAPLSQLACEILNPPQGATVLDMAAAPGGKTTYLAQLVGLQGTVIALDNDAMRLAAVRNNVERMGMTNVICVKKDARFASDLKLTFKHILLDAPCSGNFCSEKNWCGKRTIEDIKQNSRVQRELMRAAYQCLEKGGRLLYSTCSLEPEEDEATVDWALKKFNDLAVVPLSIPLGDAGATQWSGEQFDPAVSGTRRFWPHKTGMEGFFIALLEKR